MNTQFDYQFIEPGKPLSDFVDRFSLLRNIFTIEEGVIIPNGRIDLIFSKTRKEEFRVSLMGLETKAKPMPRQDIGVFFSISFHPLAVEYILQDPVADILNQGKRLPDNFWGFGISDLDDFDQFCQKASAVITALLPESTDNRKRRLFDLLFTTNGEIGIQQLSNEVFWSARQINRYFNTQFGMSLKAYCNILRFQASLAHIKEGQLFPQLNFSDQSHFIKEIKKLSGVSPKELFKNQNGRFLQFLVYDKK